MTAGMLILASVAVASAQSLADVARQEEERRKAVGTTGKVYTNEQLQPAPPPSGALVSTPATVQPAPTAPPAGAPAGEAGKPGEPAPGSADVPKTEDEWRKRIAAEREALSRAQVFAVALQNRIDALATDFVNRDDPAQRSAVADDRQKALTELDRVKREIQQHEKAIATIQEQARRAGVPAGWVR